MHEVSAGMMASYGICQITSTEIQGSNWQPVPQEPREKILAKLTTQILPGRRSLRRAFFNVIDA